MFTTSFDEVMAYHRACLVDEARITQNDPFTPDLYGEPFKGMYVQLVKQGIISSPKDEFSVSLILEKWGLSFFLLVIQWLYFMHPTKPGLRPLIQCMCLGVVSYFISAVAWEEAKGLLHTVYGQIENRFLAADSVEFIDLITKNANVIQHAIYGQALCFLVIGRPWAAYDALTDEARQALEVILVEKLTGTLPLM